MDGETGLDLTPENVEAVLGEIRPYLVGTGGGELQLVSIDGPVVKVGCIGATLFCLMRAGGELQLVSIHGPVVKVTPQLPNILLLFPLSFPSSCRSAFRAPRRG